MASHDRTELAALVEALQASLVEERAKSARFEHALTEALERQAATGEILTVDRERAGGRPAGLRGHRRQRRCGCSAPGPSRSSGTRAGSSAWWRRGAARPAAARPSWSSSRPPLVPTRGLSTGPGGADPHRPARRRRGRRLVLGPAVPRGRRDCAASARSSRCRCSRGRRRRGGRSGSTATAGGRLRARRDRAAPDLRRPGRDRDRERAAAQRAAGQECRPHRIPRAADRDERDPACHLELSDRRPAGSSTRSRRVPRVCATRWTSACSAGTETSRTSSPIMARSLPRPPSPVIRETVNGRTILDGATVHVADIQAERERVSGG